MILTVTLNPSIDKTFLLPNFTVNRLNRADYPSVVAGGKGINAASVLSLYGEEIIATGFLGGLTGRNVGEYLRNRKITTNFAQIGNTTRTNYIIYDGKQTTQINEVGPKIDTEELEHFLEIYERLLPTSDFVVIAGSIPPGIDDYIYKELVVRAKKQGVRCFVNAAGTALEHVVEEGPFIIKPDIRVNEKILDITVNNDKNKVRAARKIMQYGSEIVLFSEGLVGQIIVTRERAFIAKPKNESQKSRIGVQDSIIGAFTYGLVQKMDIIDIAKMAVCAGQAAANRVVNTPDSAEEIESCKLDVEIREIN